MKHSCCNRRMSIIAWFFTLVLAPNAQAQALEYGTCAVQPTLHFESLGYSDDKYIIFETFVGVEDGKEIFAIEIVRPQYNDHFIVGKYNVVVNPGTCEIEKTTSVL